jgi:hypothetical protein
MLIYFCLSVKSWTNTEVEKKKAVYGEKTETEKEVSLFLHRFKYLLKK